MPLNKSEIKSASNIREKMQCRFNIPPNYNFLDLRFFVVGGDSFTFIFCN